jgi:hypothetical protein
VRGGIAIGRARLLPSRITWRGPLFQRLRRSVALPNVVLADAADQLISCPQDGAHRAFIQLSRMRVAATASFE